MTLALVFIAWVVAWRMIRRPGVSSIAKWGCLAPVLIFGPLILVVLSLDSLIPSAARKALPSGAMDVQEYYSGCVDFVRCLKAALPEEQYPLYAKNLGLQERFDPAMHAKFAPAIDLGVGGAPSWWNPPSASSTTYFEYTEGKQSICVLKYANGHVYFMASSW